MSIDDIFIYRLAADRFMVVVNAANDDQDWSWVNAIHAGTVQIDPNRAGANLTAWAAHVKIRNLRATDAGDAGRVDVAVQGPKSRDVVLALDGSAADKAAIKALAWGEVTSATLGGFDLIVSRTGYTGERIAYELFAHPDRAPDLIRALIDHGAVPCGLASRDSLRIEAGLPLYGHELGTADHLTPGDAGFASYVKLWKPFFVGKRAYLDHEQARDSEITRFRLIEKHSRAPQPGDPVLDADGQPIGKVTSCSVDSDGYRLGQAVIQQDHLTDGTPIQIALSSGKGSTAPATILSHFPKAKKA